jgi:hypothetical protein
MSTELEELVLPCFDSGAPPAQSIVERLKRIEWSHSKRGMLEQCPRKYYFEYYGTAQRRENMEPQRNRLRELKTLKNRHERAGEIVHLIIAHYFRGAERNDPMDAARMISWAHQIFSNDVAASRAAGQTIVQRDGKYPPAQLLEFFHGEENADEVCAEAAQKIEAALRAFHEMRALRLVRSARGHTSIRVERMFRLKDFPCRVSGVVDLAAYTNRAPGVVDWKIGVRSAGEDDSLQLNVYALWGGAEFQCAPETVRIFKAFLGSGEVVRYRCTVATVDRARRRILQDAIRMLAVDKYGREGNMAAFSPCVQRRICALCPFLTACPEGKREIYG